MQNLALHTMGSFWHWAQTRTKKQLSEFNQLVLLGSAQVFMQVFICPSNNKNIGIYIQEISKYLVTQAQLTRELLFGADM